MRLKLATGLLALILSPLALADSSGWETSHSTLVETANYETMRPPRRPGRPGRGFDQYACYAENRRGQVFRAIGRNPRRVQHRAMEHCFQYSRQCRPLGCQRIR